MGSRFSLDQAKYERVKTSTTKENPTISSNSQNNDHLHVFTYQELRKATKQFRPDQVLGESYFGNVYKGKIAIKDNCTMQVAIKEFHPHELEDCQQWMAEVNYLGNLSHPNLVRLIGYCCERDHRFLVYEYMSSGSLENHLFREHGETLNWTRRMKIALDVAKGFAFLHAAETPSTYNCFKISKILLGKDLNAKLSDFGLQKDDPLCVDLTTGYAAPELVVTGWRAKNDVYAFGMVLFEMLTGWRASGKAKKTSSLAYDLVQFLRPRLNDYGKLRRILDRRIEGQYRREHVSPVAILAFKCLSQDSKDRPPMNEVVEVLEALTQIV